MLRSLTFLLLADSDISRPGFQEQGRSTVIQCTFEFPASWFADNSGRNRQFGYDLPTGGFGFDPERKLLRNLHPNIASRRCQRTILFRLGSETGGNRT